MQAAVFLIRSNWQILEKVRQPEMKMEDSIECYSSFKGQPHLTPWVILRFTPWCLRPFFSTTYMNKSRHAALWKSLTITRYDPERDCVPCFLNQVDDVWVRLVCDGAAVNGQYSVPHLQLPTAVCWAALDDASYFVGHGHTSISSFCVNIHVFVYIVCVRNGVWLWLMDDWLYWLFYWNE